MTEENEVISDDDDDENLIQDVQYSSKSEFSKAALVKEAVSRCLELRAKPMIKGYENTSQSTDGTLKKVIIPDARMAFISSVIALRGLLEPEVRTNKEYQKFENKINEDIQKIFDDYSYEVIEIEKFLGDRPILKRTGKKFMPSMDAVLPTTTYNSTTKGFVQQKGLWNAYVDAYWDKSLEIYDNIFKEINNLIAIKQYFKPKSSY